ncbi:MAG TPA: GNAT family N-acetyltransferase [Mobilitalea sp.]|nr:GNAT family N-acetyltransferase [Mobilitalea sp.]
MNLEIKKLTPELTNDYIDYFENVAFTDNHEWAGCFCTFYHWTDELEAERKVHAESDGTCFMKGQAVKFIQNGTLQGYLAYENGSVVGWCNVNDKANFSGRSKEKRPELWEDANTTDKVKAIVCYTIAPDMRRKGIATQLLKRICEDAVTEGYDYIEAYPGKDTNNIHRNYHGPMPLYEKFGFTLHKELEGEAVVRKYL